MNSIQQVADGDILISGRNTWGVYLISRQTGQIIWTLGGKSSSFSMGPGTNFEWQHDARLTGRTMILLDDGWAGGGTPRAESQSSGKSVALDLTTMKATLFTPTCTSPACSRGMGNMQTLTNGNVFVGWGDQPYFSEYPPTGARSCDGHLAVGVSSYRAYRFPWSGQPLTPPSLASVRQSDASLIVYASWNGATQVATWQVLGALTPARRAPWPPGARAALRRRSSSPPSPPTCPSKPWTSMAHTLGTSEVQATGA